MYRKLKLLKITETELELEFSEPIHSPWSEQLAFVEKITRQMLEERRKNRCIKYLKQQKQK